MTERKQRWLARTFWVTLFSAVPVCLGIWLSTLKVHNVKSHWLWFGHMHNALEGTLAVLLYTVVGGMVVIVVVTGGLTLFGWTEGYDTRHEGLIPKLWRIAWKS